MLQRGPPGLTLPHFGEWLQLCGYEVTRKSIDLLGETRLGTPFATRFLIEFPQAARNMLPIIIAQLVVLLKDTALAYVISYPELLRLVPNLSNAYGSSYRVSVFLVVLAIYLIMNLLLSWLARVVARRTGPGAAPRIPRRFGVFGPRVVPEPVPGVSRGHH